MSDNTKKALIRILIILRALRKAQKDFVFKTLQKGRKWKWLLAIIMYIS
jgi:hypothetical protein